MGKDASDSTRDRLLSIAADLRRRADVLEAVALHAPLPEADGAIVSPADAERALRRFLKSGRRSSLMRLPRPLLRDLAARLLEPGVVGSLVLDWLRDQADQPVSRSAFYRFWSLLLESLPAAIMAQPAGQAMLDSELHELLDRLRASGSHNRLLELPDEELVEAFRCLVAGDKAAARAVLAEAAGGRINPGQLNHLVNAFHRQLPDAAAA